MATNRLIECSCPSCKKRYFVERDMEIELPPIAYQFGKKKIYHLVCGYCQRLSAAPAFADWANKHLAHEETKPPKRVRSGKTP